MELGYWNIKGLAEPIRILLAYFKLGYKDVTFASVEEAHASFAKHNFAFPNLPYLVDGDVHVTESKAIPIYLAQKAKRDDFFGKKGIDEVHQAEIIGVLSDLGAIHGPTFFSDKAAEFYKSKEAVFEKKFGQLSKVLGEKEFLLGYITYADFILSTNLHLYIQITKALNLESVLAKYPNLLKHYEHISNLPGVKEYMASDAAQKRPTMPASAKLQIQ